MKAIASVTVTACVLIGLVASTGCVSMEEHQKVLAANRRVNEELQSCKTQLKQAQSENEQLSQRLKEAEDSLQSKDAQIASLRQETQLLQSSLSQVQRQLAQLSESKPPELVAIRLPQPVHQALEKLADSYPDIIEYLPKYGMVKFKADLTFAKGSDEVTPQAAETLRKLVEILKSRPAAGFNVYVAGHTDDIPISKPETRRRHPNNWYLSVHRAVSVQKILAAAGLAPERIGVMGFGQYHPIAPNAPSHGGNRLNRRVEIWIVPPDQFLTVSQKAPEPVEEK